MAETTHTPKSDLQVGEKANTEIQKANTNVKYEKIQLGCRQLAAVIV